MTIPQQWLDFVNAASKQYNVPPDLLRALFQHESSWNPNCVGDSGAAYGLGQMHQAAAAEIGVDWSKLGDPAVAIPATAAYLAKYFAHFRDWSWTLAAYNQGPTVVGRAKAYADAVTALRGKV